MPRNQNLTGLPEPIALRGNGVGQPMSVLRDQELSRSDGRKAALGKSTEYLAICYQHGETLFDTPTGACLSCLAKHEKQLPLVAYRAAYAVLYPHTCERHGPTLHHVGNFKCAECFTATGQPRTRSTANTDPARMGAKERREGTYRGQCATHGATEHNTARGQCLECFTTLGKPRQPVLGDPRRVEARRTGASRYMATCEVHGEVPHHTVRGRCLTCFNTLGYPRAGAIPKG